MHGIACDSHFVDVPVNRSMPSINDVNEHGELIEAQRHKQNDRMKAHTAQYLRQLDVGV